jgi:hypothetical protein
MMSSLICVWRSSSATTPAGGVDFEHHVMRLAVLGDLVRQATQTPALGLDDPAFVIVHDLGGGFRQGVHLRLCQILARKEHVLV